MCDLGTCRQCRLEDRLLEEDMGVKRKYIQGRRPSLDDNIVGRKVIGHGLTSAESSTMTKRLPPPRAPMGQGLSKADRARVTAEERKEERDLQEVVINGQIEMRLVSRYCPCHGTPSGYINWYCRCGHCSAANTQNKAERKVQP